MVDILLFWKMFHSLKDIPSHANMHDTRGAPFAVTQLLRADAGNDQSKIKIINYQDKVPVSCRVTRQNG